VLAFFRPENIEVLGDSDGRDDAGVFEGLVDQIVFEGPTVRLTLDCDGVPLKVTVGGLERLTLLDVGKKRLRVRPRQVSLVKEPAI
jgi:TOBE domain